MKPEDALRFARVLARKHARPLRAEVESEALYAYALALRAWRSSGGASLRRYCDRRMIGGALEAVRTRAKYLYKHKPWELDDIGRDTPRGRVRLRSSALEDERAEEWAPIYTFEPTGYDARELVRIIACRTSRRTAHAAWLIYGLEWTGKQVARLLGVTEARVWQMMAEARRACA